MARPRKEEGSIDACQKLADAFWELLKERQLNEITVGTIAAQAGVNRGTFYYHFDDINDMIARIIKDEMFRDNFIPNAIFSMATGAEEDQLAFIDEFMGCHFERISILIEKGGQNLVSNKIKAIIVEMWAAVLLTTEQEMNFETRLIIECLFGAVLSMISFMIQQNDPKRAMIKSQDFRSALSDLLLTRLAIEEGLAKEELLSRLLMVGRFSGASKGRAKAQTK